MAATLSCLFLTWEQQNVEFLEDVVKAAGRVYWQCRRRDCDLSASVDNQVQGDEYNDKDKYNYKDEDKYKDKDTKK